MATKPKKSNRRGNQLKAAGDNPYRVGYGRPPLATCFKPNQSGNPKGRPRRPLTLRAVVEKVLEEKIDVREGDRILRMSNRQALARAALRRALNGGPKLLRALALMMRVEIGSEQPEDEAAARVSASDEAILADFIRRQGPTDRESSQMRPRHRPPLSERGTNNDFPKLTVCR